MGIDIRDFNETDSGAVETLFIAVNRGLATPATADRFEHYIAISLAEEIRRIDGYYKKQGGQFWVAHSKDTLVGMAGVKHPDVREQGRSSASPKSRRQGVARKLLSHAE